MSDTPTIDELLLRIVETGILNMRAMSGDTENLKAIWAEANHLHNLPGIIHRSDKYAALKYYENDRAEYMLHGDPKRVQKFHEHWKMLYRLLLKSDLPE